MEFHLNDSVYVIDKETSATRPCSKCGQSAFETRYVIIEAEVAEVLVHLSATDDPQRKYRVRVDDEIQNLSWHEPGVTLFGHLSEAEARLIELEGRLGV